MHCVCIALPCRGAGLGPWLGRRMLTKVAPAWPGLHSGTALHRTACTQRGLFEFTIGAECRAESNRAERGPPYCIAAAAAGGGGPGPRMSAPAASTRTSVRKRCGVGRGGLKQGVGVGGAWRGPSIRKSALSRHNTLVSREGRVRDDRSSARQRAACLCQDHQKLRVPFRGRARLGAARPHRYCPLHSVAAPPSNG